MNRTPNPVTGCRSQASPPGLFASDGIPTTFIVAPDGRIIVRHVGIARCDDPTTVRFADDPLTRAQLSREPGTMSSDQVAPETKGVTVKLLTTVDLGPEIEGMAGRQLRMRLVTIEPGGVFGPIRGQIDRPGTVYILQGTITDHRSEVARGLWAGSGLARG